MIYKVVLKKENDGRYSIYCPTIKGCHSWGATKEEALNNIREAIEGCLEVLNEQTEELRNNSDYEIRDIAICKIGTKERFLLSSK